MIVLVVVSLAQFLIALDYSIVYLALPSMARGLALAPAVVADYVAAHECAHLLQANHSPMFWAEVRRLIGDPRPHRAWLRAHAADLHRFGG